MPACLPSTSSIWITAPTTAITTRLRIRWRSAAPPAWPLSGGWWCRPSNRSSGRLRSDSCLFLSSVVLGSGVPFRFTSLERETVHGEGPQDRGKDDGQRTKSELKHFRVTSHKADYQVIVG